jgi:peptide deformylase
MVRIMRENNGVGITATQIGKPLKMSIIESGQKGEAPFVFFNARYIPLDSKKRIKEGCLSYPARGPVAVRRPKKIKAWFDIWDGEKLVRVEHKMSGAIARVFQHEVDHQNGRTIYAS